MSSISAEDHVRCCSRSAARTEQRFRRLAEGNSFCVHDHWRAGALRERRSPDRFQPMRSVYLSLSVDSIEEVERIYALLFDGGQIFRPMQETFVAFRFAMFWDHFGTSWMILNERPGVANSGGR
jgi:uncharacterized glyoxalase superfamily protein PhnB